MAKLARAKPEVEHLTLFYLNLAFGGALGSVFVSLLAPQLFTQFYEFVLGIVVVYLLFVFSIRRDQNPTEQRPIAALFGLNQVKLMSGASMLCVGLVALMFFFLDGLNDRFTVDGSRNFYGILSVKDVNH